MKKTITTWVMFGLAVLILLIISGAFFTVQETEQVIVTQFGKPVGDPITTAGLHFKLPIIQTANFLEKRVLEWDGASTEIPTEDKLYIVADAFGRWRISDPLTFLLRMGDQRRAQSRLDDIIGSEIRNTVARHPLVELIRTTKGRHPMQDAGGATDLISTSVLPPIEMGRVKLEDEITRIARDKVAAFGIELLNVRFKRIDYNPSVARVIYGRMNSERRQIADRFRSEGAGEAARIIGTKERDVKEIQSEAYRKAQVIQGKADAEAIAIYAAAYNQNPESREFYAFQRALDVYRLGFQKGTSVVLTTESGLLKYMRGDFDPNQAGGNAAAPPAPAANKPAQ